MKLNDIISQIEGKNEKIADIAREKWDSVAKPLGSLGVLEEIITQIASCEGKIRLETEKKAVVVFCADNGVVAEGVSQTNSSVTRIVAAHMCSQNTTVCKMAAVAGAEVLPVDIGMNEKVFESALTDLCVRRGTRNFAKENALTREEVLTAIEKGANFAILLSEMGYNLTATGEMGIGNTTTSAAVLCAALQKRAQELAGRGAGLTDEAFKRKIDVINRALTEREFERDDIISILSAFGGLDIAGMCGYYLGAAFCKKCVLLDGFISQTAAFCTVKLCEKVKDYLIATHQGSEIGSKIVLEELKLSPFIFAGLHLGEGTGAVLAFPMIEMAKKVFLEMSTFDEIHVEAYKR